MNVVRIFAGVLVGVATGALLGVLFAPAKGSDTRRKISQLGMDAATDIKEKFEHVEEGVADAFEKVKHKVEDFRKDGKVEMKS